MSWYIAHDKLTALPGGEEGRRLNNIVLGLKLVECKSEKPKFLSNPNSYFAIGAWGGGVHGLAILGRLD